MGLMNNKNKDNKTYTYKVKSEYEGKSYTKPFFTSEPIDEDEVKEALEQLNPELKVESVERYKW